MTDVLAGTLEGIQDEVWEVSALARDNPKRDVENLSSVPVEDIKVKKQQTPASSKIDSKEFCESLSKEFSEGKVWRTSKALAEKLNVDVIELDNFLRKQQTVCSRASKDEGVFLYALIKRVEEHKQTKAEEKVESILRPLASEEDKYAIASLHSAYLLLDSALQKYAVKIHERNSEAFANLIDGKNKVEAGIVLLSTKVKADLSKLPKM